MKFDKLDNKLRLYETAHDFCVPPSYYIIARVDGRGFTKLTKEKHDFEKPFDERFKNLMKQTVEHLVNTDFSIDYAYSQSDEISLLFNVNEDLFSRKLRKYNSLLAAEASAKFSVLLNETATFDCRISQLPSLEYVIDYFRWRMQDAYKNALNAHCYWLLRKKGKSKVDATETISGKSTSFKNELLFENGINFNDLPNWQKRGFAVYFSPIEKMGYNPKKKQIEKTIRRKLVVNESLPLGEKYFDLLNTLLR